MESQTSVLGFSFFFFQIFSLFYHLKNSFSKMHYLPFNQLPITSPKASKMKKKKRKLGSHSFVLFFYFYLWSDWKYLNDLKKRRNNPGTMSIVSLLPAVFYRVYQVVLQIFVQLLQMWSCIHLVVLCCQMKDFLGIFLNFILNIIFMTSKTSGLRANVKK